MSDKVWTEERIRELVPEATRIDCPDKPAGHVYQMEGKDGTWAINKSDPFWLALLQTREELEIARKAVDGAILMNNERLDEIDRLREELETAKKDMVDGAMKFDDQVVENYRFRAALERIANHLQSPADTRFILIAIKAEISSVLTPKGANECIYTVDPVQDAPYPRKKFKSSCGLDVVLMEQEVWDGEKLVPNRLGKTCMKCGKAVSFKGANDDR